MDATTEYGKETRSKKRWSDAIYIASLVCIAWFQFHTITQAYWRSDDTSILYHIIKTRGLEDFYIPNIWQQFSPNNLTPWLTTSFKIDQFFAPFSPRFFYIHQLIDFFALLIILYFTLKRWLPGHWAFISLAIFSYGAPTFDVVQQLMNRHYLEGAIFATITLGFFSAAIRTENFLYAIIASITAALAMTAKEVYIPLALVALLIPNRNGLWATLRTASPMLAVLGIYIIWRHYMLGVSIGGYSPENDLLRITSLKNAINGYAMFPSIIFGRYWIFCTLVVVALIGAWLAHNPKRILLFFALIIATLGPLYPLAAFPQLNHDITRPSRYFFLLWLTLCIVFITAASELLAAVKPRKLWNASPLAAVGFFGGISIAHSAHVDIAMKSYLHAFDSQGKFIFSHDKKTEFIPSKEILNWFWYYNYACLIKKTRNETCPIALIPGIMKPTSAYGVYRYDSHFQSMKKITKSELDAWILEHNFNTSHALQIRGMLNHGELQYNLGPYTQGEYFVASTSLGRKVIPKSASYFLGAAVKELDFYIQYQSPKGWTTQSPLLKFVEGHPFAWSRPDGRMGASEK